MTSKFRIPTVRFRCSIVGAQGKLLQNSIYRYRGETYQVAMFVMLLLMIERTLYIKNIEPSTTFSDEKHNFSFNDRKSIHSLTIGSILGHTIFRNQFQPCYYKV